MTTGTALHWIDGTWVGPGGRGGAGIRPALGERGTDRRAGDGQEMAARALAAARRAFGETRWKDDRHLRARTLHEMADVFAAHIGQLTEALAQADGRPRQHARFEAETAPSRLRYFASLVRTGHGRALEVAPGNCSLVLRRPRGVAGIVVPGRSPVVLLICSLAPALAAGTTSVVRMPGRTARVNALVFGIFSEIESLPRGVVNGFTEDDGAGARYLVAAADVPCALDGTAGEPSAMEDFIECERVTITPGTIQR
ncbi:aldehyde dehydrogenase family protein [Streptomyces marianii]|uniref:Aldehyde dehydrogenase family protein n=1 Tax=Streptomyces marianii TaxID=1817406 RepID=A0A5R9E2G2_9ACTN|nr:aldehyde dehydrogenase family protein [Streptomyces marianii]TLQ43199.1 aldehyde dehydrogenase family protein [Streptomyces marianii]